MRAPPRGGRRRPTIDDVARDAGVSKGAVSLALNGRPGVSGLAFAPDGRALATDDGQVVRLWEGILWRNLADLQTQVCSLVAGDLTRAEWTSIAPGIAYRRSCG